MRTRSIAIFATIVAALCLSTAYSEKRTGDTLKVMSYNVRNSKAKDGENAWEERKAATPAMLDAVNPDIFGVQEAYPNQVFWITENCSRYVSFGVGREDGVDQGEHMSIFYNSEAIEMIEGGTYWLSETPDTVSKGWDAACKRTATWALLRDKDSDRKFYFVNTHLDHKGIEARRKGLALIVDKIGEMNAEGLPMVLTGDFNVEPADSALIELNQIMKSARVEAKNSDERASFNGFGLLDQTVIDYIYYSGFAECTDFKVICDSFAGKPYVSDHYPIVSTLVY